MFLGKKLLCLELICLHLLASNHVLIVAMCLGKIFVS